MRLCRGWAAALAVALLGGLAGCGQAATSGAAPSGLRIYAGSATETAIPTPPSSATGIATPKASNTPLATPTAGPLVWVVDFTSERKELTLHVGQRMQLKLTQGPRSDWLSGVDDARVLLPVSPEETGVYQALSPGTTLVTAHVPFGCANVSPGVPCKPETGLLLQMRVYVIP